MYLHLISIKNIRTIDIDLGKVNEYAEEYVQSAYHTSRYRLDATLPIELHGRAGRWRYEGCRPRIHPVVSLLLQFALRPG